MLDAMRRPGTAGVVLALAVALALALFLPGGRDRVATTPVEPSAEYDHGDPNIVVVMTDDQALDTMRAMPAPDTWSGARA